ncbi:MAG TPA: helix-turn-helix domain-containing protein [Mycobacteriales bacterium]
MAPTRTGTRVRAGNAMSRTRAAVLAAALRLVAERGTRHTSMADLAGASGIAKGTLYNHFRTKEDVWAAVLTAEIEALAEVCAGLELGGALAVAAERVAAHPAVRRLAADEPATLTALLSAPATAPARRLATDAVRRLLAGAGRDPDAADLVLRWLESHLARPAPAGCASPALLAVMLPSATIVLD